MQIVSSFCFHYQRYWTRSRIKNLVLSSNVDLFVLSDIESVAPEVVFVTLCILNNSNST
jgi:hypothetical protein